MVTTCNLSLVTMPTVFQRGVENLSLSVSVSVCLFTLLQTKRLYFCQTW